MKILAWFLFFLTGFMTVTSHAQMLIGGDCNTKKYFEELDGVHETAKHALSELQIMRDKCTNTDCVEQMDGFIDDVMMQMGKVDGIKENCQRKAREDENSNPEGETS